MNNLIEIKNIGNKKNKKYNLNYMSVSDFKEYSKKEKVKIIGTTRLKEIREDKIKDANVYLSTSDKKYFKLTKFKFGLKNGYINVGDEKNKFILYRKSNLGFLIILLILLMIGCLLVFGNNNGKIELEDFNPINLYESSESDSNTRHYDFQTLGSYEISEENTYIKVWNPETNTRIFQYEIYIDGELFAETKGISPGNMREIDCASLLQDKGEHELILDLTVLNEETGEVVGQAQRNAVLTVK